MVVVVMITIMIMMLSIVTYLNIVADFEPFVLSDQTLEHLGQTYMVANILLQAGYAEAAHDKPQFERTEPATERHSPVAVVDRRVGVSVLQVERIDDQSRRQTDAIAHPHRRAVEVHQ